MLKRILYCFYILIFAANAVYSQNAVGTISGTITDENSAVVAGAKVTISSRSNNTEKETTTDANGSFRIENLPPGNYKITVSAKNFSDSMREIQLSGSALSVDFRLSVSKVSATVNVEAETARIELERVPGGTELLSRREIQQTQATTLKDVLNFTPGVLAQPRYGSDEVQFSVHGSGLRNNYHARGINILINGLPYGDADGFSDFESLEFLTANRVEVWKGANALRYGGNTAGGAINLVTETGETASFRPSAAIFRRASSIISSRLPG